MDFSYNRSFILILLIQYIAHYRVIKVIAWLPYSRNDRRTCLRRCFKENFNPVNILTENISCEISKLVTITTT